MAGWDYVIVGAGSAGCLLANRLSADPARKVLLLEAGGQDGGFWLKVPVGYYRSVYDPRVSRTFLTEPEEGTAGRATRWPRGRVLGGSSSINGLIFIRGDRAVYDAWGVEGWGARDVVPFFRKLERYEGGESQERGGHGELVVQDLRDDAPQVRHWLEAAAAAGHDAVADFNAGPSTVGMGRFQLSVGGHWRMSAARAFLRPAEARENLTVRTGAEVARVVVEKGRARGVEFRWQGGTHRVEAGEVILCAGAIQSPQLLQLSGIGPEAVLRAAGVAVLADRPEVGGNLQDHYQMRVILKMRDKRSLNLQTRNPLWLARAAAEWVLAARGPLTIGAGQVGGGIRTQHAVLPGPDLQVMAMPFSSDAPDAPLHPHPGFTSVVWQCYPDSRGRVDIRSADPGADPVIRPNYLTAERDRAVLVEGVKRLREIHAAVPFGAMVRAEVIPGPEARTDAEILDSIRRTAATVYHPCGTCRMGEDEAAPVDARLRVRGVEGLRVADASVMPIIPSGNINAPTLMVAEKAADVILADA